MEFPVELLVRRPSAVLTVYVDDLLLSGPIKNHSQFWRSLQTGTNPIKIDPPELLDRFLGRKHVFTPLGLAK